MRAELRGTEKLWDPLVPFWPSSSPSQDLHPGSLEEQVGSCVSKAWTDCFDIQSSMDDLKG